MDFNMKNLTYSNYIYFIVNILYSMENIKSILDTNDQNKKMECLMKAIDDEDIKTIKYIARYNRKDFYCTYIECLLCITHSNPKIIKYLLPKLFKGLSSCQERWWMNAFESAFIPHLYENVAALLNITSLVLPMNITDIINCKLTRCTGDKQKSIKHGIIYTMIKDLGRKCEKHDVQDRIQTFRIIMSDVRFKDIDTIDSILIEIIFNRDIEMLISLIVYDWILQNIQSNSKYLTMACEMCHCNMVIILLKHCIPTNNIKLFMFMNYIDANYADRRTVVYNNIRNDDVVETLRLIKDDLRVIFDEEDNKCILLRLITKKNYVLWTMIYELLPLNTDESLIEIFDTIKGKEHSEDYRRTYHEITDVIRDLIYSMKNNVLFDETVKLIDELKMNPTKGKTMLFTVDTLVNVMKREVFEEFDIDICQKNKLLLFDQKLKELSEVEEQNSSHPTCMGEEQTSKRIRRSFFWLFEKALKRNIIVEV